MIDRVTLDRQVHWTEWIKQESSQEAVEQFGYNPAGCGNCKYGIISEPDMSRVVGPLYLKRCIAAAHGAVLFCDCQAGKDAYKYVDRLLSRMPSHMMDPDSRLIYLRKRDDGTLSWLKSAPHDYIPPSLVRAIVDLINEPPPMHVAEEEIDIF